MRAGGPVRPGPLPPTSGMAGHHGACHCGALELSYESAIAPAETELRACQCSFCRKRASLAISDPNGHVNIHINDPAQLQRYQFGLRTDEYSICRNCGTYISAIMAEGDRTYAEQGIR